MSNLGKSVKKIFTRRRPQTASLRSEKVAARTQGQTSQNQEPVEDLTVDPRLSVYNEPMETSPEPRIDLIPAQNDSDSEDDREYEPQDEPEDEPEDEDDDDDEVDEEGGGEVTSYPGGPRYKTLLLSYETHIAKSIWEGKDDRILKCINHIGKLKKWELDLNKLSEPIQMLIINSGLLCLVNGSGAYDNVDKTLVNAFVERWHPETNSFHMPFGEMTITLEDVYCLTLLPVVGAPLFENPVYASQPPLNKVCEVLGVTKKFAKDGIPAKGALVNLEWLRLKFSPRLYSSDPQQAVCAAKAYLLYLLGCTIFSDKTGTCVNASYLDYLRDDEAIGGYAWGAGALAFLYRQLGKGSRFNCHQISGHLTLLEAWVYERFPAFRNGFNNYYLPNLPLTLKWVPPRAQPATVASVQVKRQHIDILQDTDVIWMPYEGIRAQHPFPIVALYQGAIVAGNVVEPHLPDRVLRQFGYMQTIPHPPLGLGMARGDKKSLMGWVMFAQSFYDWKGNCLNTRRLPGCRVPQHASDDYLQWYSEYSHPIVHPITERSHAVRRTTEVVAPNPWDMLMNVRNVIMPMAERWTNGDRSFSLEEAMDVMFKALAETQTQTPARTSTSRGGRRRQ